MAQKYKYRFADGSIGDTPWKRDADGKHYLNREGGFLEEGTYLGYVDADGVLVPGLPPMGAAVVMGYVDPASTPEDPTINIVVAKPAEPPVEPAAVIPPLLPPEPARKETWLVRLMNWFARLFS